MIFFFDCPENRFIYELHCNSRLPWVYGGEYEEITKVVAKVVQSWISVGLKLFFVFDGLPILPTSSNQ
jgi:hypothetical protein